MILTGKAIKEAYTQQEIIISPFVESHITTNSYDLRLGDKLIYYTDDILDPQQKNNYEEIILPQSGYELKKNSFHLGSSYETVGSIKYVPIIHAKSGIARLGLFIHVTADLIDIGYIGNVTFQLFATESICVYPQMLIAQITFWKPQGEITLYDGKYQNGEGPQTSKTYQDYIGI